MCGIAALLGDLPSDQIETWLRGMLDAQAHRGPDDSGSVLISTGGAMLGLGNRRLAIQDISPRGHQPMRNEKTGDVLVYNGEIYNAPELKEILQSAGHRFCGHSDTEVLLRGYEEWGIDCLDRVRGMFAFALWDARRTRLIIARDHFGIKPLYYAKGKSWIACASEVQALTHCGLMAAEVDRRALAGYLAYGGVQEPLTMVADVFALPRGSWKEFDASGTVTGEGKYWEFPRLRRSAEVQPLSEIVEEGRVLLQKAIKRHLLSDVRIGVFLSGGLDSTAILGLARDREGGHPLEAFTVSFPDRPDDDECEAAQATAARFASPFNKCQVSDSTALRWMADALARIDQPSMDGFNTYVVARAAREQGIVVALSGLGGDEIFGGYNLFRRVPRTYNFMSWLNPLPQGLRKAASTFATAFNSQIAKGKAEEIVAADPGLIGIYFHYRRLLSNSNLAAMGLNAKDLDLSEDFQLRECRYEDCYVPGDHVASVGRLDSSFYLQNILLRDSDVFGMANSLEIRVPFLGRDLTEWALGLPGNVLLPQGAPQKYMLRKMCASVYTKTQLKQPKRGFALPFAAWLQGPLRELMERNLRLLRLSGLLDPRGIDLLRKMFDAEPNGPAWSRIWALVVLGSWLQKQQHLTPRLTPMRLSEQRP
ncbi:MAG TPA: asparagine synthase (glutamine-hydrolyzing) [Candidatus Sulfotelmatobacter sp.]